MREGRDVERVVPDQLLAQITFDCRYLFAFLLGEPREFFQQSAHKAVNLQTYDVFRLRIHVLRRNRRQTIQIQNQTLEFLVERGFIFVGERIERLAYYRLRNRIEPRIAVVRLRNRAFG